MPEDKRQEQQNGSYAALLRDVALALSQAMHEEELTVLEVAEQTGMHANRIRHILCAEDCDLTISDLAALEARVGCKIRFRFQDA